MRLRQSLRAFLLLLPTGLAVPTVSEAKGCVKSKSASGCKDRQRDSFETITDRSLRGHYRKESRRNHRQSLSKFRVEEREEKDRDEDPNLFPPPPNYTGWSPGLLALRDGRVTGGESGKGTSEVFMIPAPPGRVRDNALSVFEEIRRNILERWGSKYANTTLFSGGMEFSDGGAVVEDKMLSAVLEQRGFLAAFTGVSTTAGHDILYEQSYPVILNDTMGRLMAATGVRFEAINVAMGNTRVAPYSFCVDAHAGLEADIISWDNYMGIVGNRPNPSGVELFVRSALVLPRRPAVLLIDATTDNRRCEAEGTVLRLQRRNDALIAAGEEKGLMEVYREFGLHRMTPSSLVPENTCGDGLFDHGRLYNCSLKDTDPHCKPWHAAPPGHQLVADMLFMHYAPLFLSALGRLETAIPGATADELRRRSATGDGGRSADGQGPGTTKPLRQTLGLGALPPYGVDGQEEEEEAEGGIYMGGGRGNFLPAPAWCAEWMLCSGAGDFRCATSYFPLAGRRDSRLLEMVVSDEMPALGLSDYFPMPSPGHWSVTLNEEAVNLLSYLRKIPPEGFHHPIDVKWVLAGDASSGPIEFEFNTVGVPPGRRMALPGIEGRDDEERRTNMVARDSRVVVCKPDFVDRKDFTNSTQVRFRVDGVEAVAVELEQGTFMMEGSCVTLEAEVGVGRHTVTVEPLEVGDPYVAISHLVYPA